MVPQMPRSERRKPAWRRPRLWLLGAGLAVAWVVLDARCAGRAGHDAAVRDLVLDFVADVRSGDEQAACEWFAPCTGPSTPCDAESLGRLRSALVSQTEPLQLEATSRSGYFDAVTVKFSNPGAHSVVEFALERPGRSLRFRGWQLCAMRFSGGFASSGEAVTH